MITDICNLSFFSLSFCYQKVNPRVVGVRSGDSIMNQKPSPLHRASEWIVDHYRLFFVVFAALLVFSAVASGWVKVENDVAAYLPADSETRQGLDIMEQEFQTYGSAKILLRDTDADAAAATAEQIRAVDGVDSCTYTMNDTGSALLSVSLSDLEGSDTCAQTVQALRDLLDGSGAYIYSAEGYSISDQINGEVRGLLVIVAIILVTVLTFTSSTYAEVPILLITFLAAALINKGTNFVFGTISFVSNAVAILLQLAMSVDYAIIFCNRYKQAHETLPVREAVIESLEKSITVISSSSLTTIAGLVAMTFMKFGLGRDLGIVLIKAILISMLTVFLLMPGLLLKLGPAMDKTKHRNFVPKISGVGRLAWRTRRVVPLVFAAVLVVACIGANRVSYVYSEAPLKTHNADVNRTASQAITDDFGDETVLAVVVPAGDYTQEAALLDALSALPEVKSAVGIAGTEAAGGYRLADAVDYRTFAQLSGADSTSAPALFALYAAENGAAQTAAQDLSGYQVTLLKLFEFLNDKIAASDGKELSAADAFQLYDTYGFPIDLTLEVLEEQGMTTSREEFDRLMNEQRERAREDRKKMGDLGWQSEDLGLDKSIKTAFDGYDTLEESAKILAIVNEGEVSGAAAKGEKITVVLDRTPFYAEMGGQIGDHGVITGKNGAMTVSDVQKTKDGKYMHIGVVTEGELSVEDEVTASVDAAYRQAICRAHTSTHLLQKALRKVLGDHVEQAGSYTANDHIRFDFTHFAALTPEELAKVEELVNDAILAGSPVITEEMSIDEAKKKGAMALFGEKYGQTVRVVQAGDSIELCGGTHLDNTAKAGSLKIIGEASVAAGVRRIEAVTGKAVLKLMNDRQAVLNEAAAALKTNPNELSAKIEQQVNDMRALNKKLEKMGAKVAAMQMVDLFNVSRNIKGVDVVATKLDDASPEMLRTMGDDIKGKKDNMVAVLSAVNGDKVSLLCVCGAEAVKKGAHAGKIIKEVAKIVGGGGGGRPDSATAGGKNPAKLEEALEAVNNIVDAML